uniref:Uncharacterized protein n=1 Tax=Saimiri boliviensis boliviensis TaxID=39432 RepID=A0A2K6UF06_SAIBB
MSFCPNPAGEVTHPSSGMLACSCKVIGITTPTLVVLASQSKVCFFCMPVPTIPQEWTRVWNSGRKQQQ